jgi:hypothetical protein
MARSKVSPQMRLSDLLVIPVYYDAGNVIEPRQHKGDFKEGESILLPISLESSSASLLGICLSFYDSTSFFPILCKADSAFFALYMATKSELSWCAARDFYARSLDFVHQAVPAALIAPPVVQAAFWTRATHAA